MERHALARLKEASALVENARNILKAVASFRNIDFSVHDTLQEMFTDSPAGTPSSSPRAFRTIPLRNATAPNVYSTYHGALPISPRQMTFSTSQRSHRSSTSSSSSSFMTTSRSGGLTEDPVTEVHDSVHKAHLILKKARNSHPRLGVVKESEVGERCVYNVLLTLVGGVLNSGLGAGVYLF